MAANPWGFLRLARVDPRRRPVSERLRDWRVVLEAPGPAAVQAQATRCMDCGVAFCHAGCPLGNLIPDWDELVARDRWRPALEALHATNNFPEFTGWLCPAPCESACVLGIDDEPVAIKQIELAIVDRGWAEGWITPMPARAHTGRRVAVVGSGPAGLAGAQQLARGGHDVTVFERDDRPGGLLRYGIPDFKLPKAALNRRLGQLVDEGVVFRCGVDVGRDLAGDELRAEFDAVVLACGAQQARPLPVPGRCLAGIHDAMEYLALANRVQLGDLAETPVSASGKRVVIVGGGDTAADCLGTANRQGAASVTQIDHNPRPPDVRDDGEPWPTPPTVHKVSPAHEEGITEEWGTEVVSFVGCPDDEAVTAVRTVPVRAYLDAPGQRRFQVVDGHDGPGPQPHGSAEVPAELVLVAAGFIGTTGGVVLDQLGVTVAAAPGTIVVDERWQAAEGVFACGDATRGASLVVWAIAEGRACAAAVDAYLAGVTQLPAPVVPGERRFASAASRPT
ncbi:MAG: glutamate synthase subunit beta [Acidimicrobiia bacterium]